MKENKNNKIFWIIFIAVTVMFMMIPYNAIKQGGINTTGSKGTDTYKTLDEVKSSIGMNLTVPDGIDTTKIIEIRSYMGQLIEIRADHYILKAATFVDASADPLGLYSKAETDNKYTVSNSDITFFRYRVGYPEYTNCTLLNWCNKTTAMGIMLDEVITEEQAIEIMGLTQENLNVYNSNTEVDNSKEKNTTDTAWKTYSIASDTITISLPEMESEVRAVDLDGYTILFLNDSRCLVVVYSDYAIDTNVFSGEGKIDIDEHTRICYLLENEFNVNTAEYRDYNVILNNIQDIASRIKRK